MTTSISRRRLALSAAALMSVSALAFTIGALISWVWAKMKPQNQERYNIPIASGLVAGESLIKALLAMLSTAIGLLSSK